MHSTVAKLKRAFDLIGSGAGLLLSSPLLGAIALAIKLDDGGPIFYSQTRVGGHMSHEGDATDCYEYQMWKFRTMRTDAEKGGQAIRAGKSDPRVTRIGKFLRKTRLDEIPNLFNVFVGQMSIVGPRPERPQTIQTLAAAIPFFEERMRMVKPGVTGLAQINLDYLGRMGETHELATMRQFLTNPFGLDYEVDESPEADDMRTKILFDFAYAASLEKVSSFLRTDLEILFRTPLVMILGKGR